MALVIAAAYAFAPATTVGAPRGAASAICPAINMLASWNDASTPATHDPRRRQFTYGPDFANKATVNPNLDPAPGEERVPKYNPNAMVYGAEARRQVRYGPPDYQNMPPDYQNLPPYMLTPPMEPGMLDPRMAPMDPRMARRDPRMPRRDPRMPPMDPRMPPMGMGMPPPMEPGMPPMEPIMPPGMRPGMRPDEPPSDSAEDKAGDTVYRYPRGAVARREARLAGEDFRRSQRRGGAPDDSYGRLREPPSTEGDSYAAYLARRAAAGDLPYTPPQSPAPPAADDPTARRPPMPKTTNNIPGAYPPENHARSVAAYRPPRGAASRREARLAGNEYRPSGGAVRRSNVASHPPQESRQRPSARSSLAARPPPVAPPPPTPPPPAPPAPITAPHAESPTESPAVEVEDGSCEDAPLSQVKGLEVILRGAPDDVKGAALEWCCFNQVADIGILFEDPQDAELVINYFLDALPLNPDGMFIKTIHKRLDDMRSQSSYAMR